MEYLCDDGCIYEDPYEQALKHVYCIDLSRYGVDIDQFGSRAESNVATINVNILLGSSSILPNDASPIDFATADAFDLTCYGFICYHEPCALEGG